MQIPARYRYGGHTDKDLVDAIIGIPPDERAAVYLLWERYLPKFRKTYIGIYQRDMSWFDDCLHDLYAYLKGRNGDWSPLRTFQWRSRFSTWIGQVARHRFMEIKPYLIGKIEIPLSIDEEDEEGNPTVQLPDNSTEDYERRERKVLLLEAIGMLQEDDRLIMLKTLQGYNSRETAEMLAIKWQKSGVEKLDRQGRKIIPTPGYVDVRRQRAKEQLRRIIIVELY